MADFLLPSGFIQPVTGLHAEFRTELVVNLYSGWIVQLVNASFAWRTHLISFVFDAANMVLSGWQRKNFTKSFDSQCPGILPRSPQSA